MTAPAITTHELACGYGDKVILSDLDLAFPHARISCILGMSGCGKSTLLRTLLLLEAPLAGEVRFDGAPLPVGDAAALETWRRSLGVLFQGSALFNSMTLLENAAFPVLEKTELPRDLALELALLKLNLVGLARYAHYLPAMVSGGMRKRCGIARALALDPDYLFLDEPSAGLDPVTAAGIDRLILELRDTLGATVVIVTHELASIETIADHLVMLDGGGLVATGSPEEVRATDHRAVHAFFERTPPEDTAEQRSSPLLDLLLPEEA